MEAHLLAEKGIKTNIDFEKLSKDVVYVSKLKPGQGTYILSALYAAEQFGVEITSGENDKKYFKNNKKQYGHLKRYTVSSIDEIITHLNANRPVLAVSSIFEKTWYNYKGLSESPILFDSKLPYEGGQAIVISHVDLVKNRIKFAILWGKNWGYKGFGYFTEESFYKHVEKDSLYAIETILNE